MKQIKSAKMVMTCSVQATMRLSPLWVLAFLFSSVYTPTYAESTVTANEISQSIEISAHAAPLSVFIQAVFANTELEIELSESLEGIVTGNYAGSIASVLETLSSEFDVATHIEEGIVSVYPLSSAPLTQAQLGIETKTKTKTARTTRSIGALIESTNSTLRNSNENTAKKNQSPPAAVAVAQTSVEADKVLERVFVLKNAIAIDTQPSNANLSVVPGVLTQLNRIIEKLGVSNLTYVGRPVTETAEFKRSVIALPSMNAIVVKDLASRMPLYVDLIESLDVSSISTNSVQEFASDAPARKATSKWSVVQ